MNCILFLIYLQDYKGKIKTYVKNKKLIKLELFINIFSMAYFDY